MGKGEIAHYEQFLHFPQCFQKTCTADSQKNRACLGKGYANMERELCDFRKGRNDKIIKKLVFFAWCNLSQFYHTMSDFNDPMKEAF